MTAHRRMDGFSALEIIIVIAVVLLVAFGGWWVWQVQQDKNKDESASSGNSQVEQPQPKPYEGWRDYADKAGNYTVKYPADWSRDTDEQTQGDGGPVITYTTFTSSSGFSFNIDANYGGRGGSCMPAEDDVPFRAGNQCASSEKIFAERIDPKWTLYDNQGPVSLFLVGKKYADVSGSQSFLLGLETHHQDTLPIPDAVMGSVLPFVGFQIKNQQGDRWMNIEVTAAGNDESFLSSQDGETVKQILRSFTITDWPPQPW